MYLPDMDRNFNGGSVDVIDGPQPAPTIWTIDDTPSRFDRFDMTFVARITFAAFVLIAVLGAAIA